MKFCKFFLLKFYIHVGLLQRRNLIYYYYFVQPGYDFTIDENSPPGTFVGEVTATDGDPSDCSVYPQCDFGIVRYRLTGDPRFQIDPNTVSLTCFLFYRDLLMGHSNLIQC